MGLRSQAGLPRHLNPLAGTPGSPAHLLESNFLLALPHLLLSSHRSLQPHRAALFPALLILSPALCFCWFFALCGATCTSNMPIHSTDSTTFTFSQ